MSEEYIKRSDATSLLVSRLHETAQNNAGYQCDAGVVYADAADRLRLAWINDIPAADVVERQKGEWVFSINNMGYRCSLCNAQAPFWCMAGTQNLSNYCPNCGADMREERKRRK